MLPTGEVGDLFLVLIKMKMRLFRVSHTNVWDISLLNVCHLKEMLLIFLTVNNKIPINVLVLQSFLD